MIVLIFSCALALGVSFLRSVLFVSPEADLNTMLHLFIARHHHQVIFEIE